MAISSEDITVLESYRFQTGETEQSGGNRRLNDLLLCVETGPNGIKRLATVARADATRAEFIKAFFGFGKLAGKTLSLRGLSRYLCRLNLSQLKEERNSM